MFIIYGNAQFMPGKYDEWQAAYDKLAEYVFPNEPTTRTYYFSILVEYKEDFSKANQMLAFEVYEKRDDLYETHFNTKGMSQFLQATQSTMATGFDLTHHTEVSAFLDKSGQSLECVVIYDTIIHCSSSSARKTILAKLAKIADDAEKEGKGTYSFWVLKSLDHDDQVRILERYESWEALETHQNSHDLVKLYLDSAEDIKSLQGKTVRPESQRLAESALMMLGIDDLTGAYIGRRLQVCSLEKASLL